MIKTRKEKMLEARITRLEKILKCSKYITNENFPRSGMTLGEILALYTGNVPGNFSQIIRDLKMSGTFYSIADNFDVSESVAGAYIRDSWNLPCEIRVNQGAGSVGSDDVIVIVGSLSFNLDWMNEDEEAYEAHLARLEKMLNAKSKRRKFEGYVDRPEYKVRGKWTFFTLMCAMYDLDPGNEAPGDVLSDAIANRDITGDRMSISKLEDYLTDDNMHNPVTLSCSWSDGSVGMEPDDDDEDVYVREVWATDRKGVSVIFRNMDLLDYIL